MKYRTKIGLRLINISGKFEKIKPGSILEKSKTGDYYDFVKYDISLLRNTVEGKKVIFEPVPEGLTDENLMEIESLVAENNRLREKIESLKYIIKNSEENLARVTKDAEKLYAENQSLLSENDILKCDRFKLETKVKKELRAEVDKEIETIKIETVKLKEKSEQRLKTIDTLSKDYHRVNDENNRYKVRVLEYEKAIDELTIQKDGLNDKLHRYSEMEKQVVVLLSTLKCLNIAEVICWVRNVLKSTSL